MIKTCEINLLGTKCRAASAIPKTSETVVIRIAAEERFGVPEQWKPIKQRLAQAARQWTENSKSAKRNPKNLGRLAILSEIFQKRGLGGVDSSR